MKLLCKEGVTTSEKSEPKTKALEEKVIICASCSNHITDPQSKIQMNGSFTHVFANPHGYVFEIGCFSQAPGCGSGSDSSKEFSWFQGFSWQIGLCLSCSSHLGWIFSSQAKKFYGLILDKLIFP